jgi:nucleoside-diphosphate-sugar epimerase
MKVLITGAKGFSASHLISLLSHETNLRLACNDVHGKEADDWYCSDLTDYGSAINF